MRFAIALIAAVLAAPAHGVHWRLLYTDSSERVVVRDGLKAPRVLGELDAFPVALSPDGAWVALGFRTGVVIRTVDGTEERRVSRRQAAVMQWSPDSRRLAFDDSEGIWLVGRRGGRVVHLSSTATGSFYWLGDRVACVCGTAELDVLAPGRVLRRFALGPDEPTGTTVTPSPDGRWVAFARRCGPLPSGARIVTCDGAVLDARTGAIRPLGRVAEPDGFHAFTWAGTDLLFSTRTTIVRAAPATGRRLVVRHDPGLLIGAGSEGSFAYWTGRFVLRICARDGHVVANQFLPIGSASWQVAFPA